MTAQTCTDWKPKPRQKRVLEAAQEEGPNRTILMVCEEAKVPRRTFYYWLSNDPGFLDAWDKIWRGAIKRHLPMIVAAMVCKARKGDVAAARLLADMAGVLKQSIELGGPGGGAIETRDDGLERFLAEIKRSKRGVEERDD